MNNNDLVISKSNTLDENSISKFLKFKDIIIETDLVDRILKLKGKNNQQTHLTGLAFHLNVEAIAKIINESIDENVPTESKAIMKTVRKDVSNRINKADIWDK